YLLIYHFLDPHALHSFPTRRSSDLNVTSDSISSGAIPCPSVRMVTVGAVRSGKTSIGIWRAVHAPAPNNNTDKPITSQLCSIDQDRKSTRLNSSHDQISYAVFCLKK